MDLDRALLVILLTIGGVVLFNIILYLSTRRGNDVTTINMLRKAARRARNPWEDEDSALRELSEIVAGLQKKDEGDKSSDELTNNNDR